MSPSLRHGSRRIPIRWGLLSENTAAIARSHFIIQVIMKNPLSQSAIRPRIAQCLLFMAAALLPVGSALASKGVWEEYEKLIKAAETVGTVGPDQFGEQINFQRGGFSLRVTDVSIPGNNALPVAFSRTFVTKTAGGAMKGTTPQNNARDGALADWEIDLPFIGGVFPQQTGWVYSNTSSTARCSAGIGGPYVRVPATGSQYSDFTHHEYSQGVRINIPGQSGGALLNPAVTTSRPTIGVRWITSSWTAINCLSTIKNGSGEGFIAITPDGTRYWFDWMAMAQEQDLTKSRRVVGVTGIPITVYDHLPRGRFGLYATRVEDRFGNWVTYSYTNAANAPVRLSQIESSDGRLITVTHNSNGYVQNVSTNGRTWTYGYTGSGIAGTSLSSVALPDGTAWALSLHNLQSLLIRYYQGDSGEFWRNCTNPGDIVENTYVGSVKHPSGATAEYSLFPTRQRRYGINYASNCAIGDPDDPNDDSEWYPSAWDSYAIIKKRVFGSGISDQEWNYAYEEGDRTVVTGPSDYTRYTYGNTFKVNEGKLLTVERGGSAASILHREDYTYELAQSGMPYPTPIGTSPNPRNDDFVEEFLLPQKSRVVARDSATFSSLVQQYDAFARPLRTVRSSSLGSTRDDVVSYYNNLDLWVVGLPERSYNVDTGGMVEFENSYNTLGQLVWSEKFGKRQHTLTYRADGTIATVTDGRGNVTELSSWKRGIPEQIKYPGTNEAPTGATESAVIDGNGWITAVTNEVGFVTGYGYDAMGRLASVVHPTGDAIALPSASGNYYNTLRNFRPLVAADWKPAGVVDGQWRLYEEIGTRVNITYMDALWRPILKHEFDAQNTAATLRASKTTYDASGRVSFQSYPSSNTIPGDTGTRSFYDAIDRVTSVEQDSEHGVLSTTTQYLSGLKTLVTNPKGYATTTSFTAWDEPTYDFPTLSVQPEGKVIQIGRHAQFGWPQQLTQRNAANTLSATRRYVYDGHAQLCKTIEPETGVTVMDYDGAGNLAWQAAGLDAGSGSYNSLTDCQRVGANGSGRAVTRTYDPRNRLTHLTFPNGLGNQIWTYEKDNLPSSVTAYNDAGNTAPVVTSYTYNKRRLLTGETLAQPGWYSWSIGYAYDGYGHLSTQTYPTGLVVDYAPNPLGQPTKAGTFASGAQYYPNGALKQFTYGNGVVHVMLQNERQLPSRVVSSLHAINFGQNNTNAVLDNANQYDRNGNVTNIWDYARGDGYQYSRWLEYDQLDRLTAAGSVSFGGDHWHRMTYDALDNLKSWKLAGVKDYAEYVYDAQSHRLSSIRNTAGATVVGLSYDPQGNLANKNGQIYQFDYGNRLRIVNLKETYRYDGLGRRVMNWRWPQPGASTGTLSFSMYSQNGQIPYEEDHHSTPTTAKENIYLAGSIIATRENKWGVSVAVKYQHTDALGSPVAVTNASGQVIERMDYEPWGAIIGKPNHNGIGYTGHVMDSATGLTYMQQRYYDQSIGRFLSVDPVTASSSTGANFNRYWYAENNPYKFVDPDGRQSRETLSAPSAGTGMPFVDSLMKPSDVSATGKGRMIVRQLKHELAQARTFLQNLKYVAIAMSLGTRGVTRGSSLRSGAVESLNSPNQLRQVGSILESAHDVVANPSLLNGKPVAYVRALLKKTDGWVEGTLSKGRNAGKGWTLRQLNSRGSDFTDLYIQYHPGSRHHPEFPDGYWKVSSGQGGTVRVPAQGN
jgi:RHS repeat-associated protein